MSAARLLSEGEIRAFEQAWPYRLTPSVMGRGLAVLVLGPNGQRRRGIVIGVSTPRDVIGVEGEELAPGERTYFFDQVLYGGYGCGERRVVAA